MQFAVKRMSAEIKRTTLVVRSAARSMAFYREVLGFTTAFDHELTMSASGYPAGNAGDRIRLAMMQGSDPNGSMIGLLEHLDPRLPEPAERPVGIGDTVIVMQTGDLDRVLRECAASGVRIFSEPHAFSISGPDGEPVQMRSMTIFDPDGFILEINQRPG